MVESTLQTSLVGSYAQPNWLIDKQRLGQRLPPRVVLDELWKVNSDALEEAQNDATILALDDQHRAGVDIVTDGEMRRESYSNRFANALDGIDIDNPGEAIDRTGKAVPVPRVVGEVSRRQPVEVPYIKFLKAHTNKPIKITLPGPFTMSQQAQNDYYADQAGLAMAYAEAVNAEMTALFAAGVDIVQLDEPYVQARPEAAEDYALEAIDKALAGASGSTVLHVCFGYGKHVADKPSGYAFLDALDACRADEISIECAQPRLKMDLVLGLPSKRIHVGVIDLRDTEVESADTVARRIEAALEFLPPTRLVVAPDCGMKYLTRDVAFAKLCNMVTGRDLVLGQVQ
ncbi:MAG: 5-methyltetrahydropteroyltriglutamate--homocysteine methyltransferase [Gammaproteobacteria bacterium]|jgi:5-methyltetrahydropteroyltriglutamate--homocysteine methyltransferase|nr:5-methyltetrahydropteroyltriglutamate--homocysteine methyltransferase [Gammaproteobacteria bacterium]MBT5603617.1 5-methyltetrahydropteroyltriglutamate--homocysteine methyltransferase [Gammaproteobacteria bacterium]MBT6245762.1 5-methyltetrahydropteroyltriglutamate--homocysteine methyltransferase [Gammaproteobacteria bacterium]